MSLYSRKNVHMNVCPLKFLNYKGKSNFKLRHSSIFHTYAHTYCCDAFKRKTRGTQKGWEKNIYIQVTETRYKWTWLNSSLSCNTKWVARQADDFFVCFGAKPDKGFLDLKSRRIRKWKGTLNWRRDTERGSRLRTQ